jgi:hypothetical protein
VREWSREEAFSASTADFSTSTAKNSTSTAEIPLCGLPFGISQCSFLKFVL